MADHSTESKRIKLPGGGGAELSATLVRPITASKVDRAVIVLHGFPSRDLEAAYVASSLPEIANRISTQMLSLSMVLDFQGCGDSDGNFSLASWVSDVKSAVRYLTSEHGIKSVWICGFGTGGSVGLVAASTLQEVAGVVTLGSPADFDDWSADPDQLLSYAREIGAIKSSEYPKEMDLWRSEIREVRAVKAADQFSPKPLLVLHGSEDVVVPHFDARLIADAHGDADLRFISGGGHQLKHDPRAVAVLLGWLGRQQILGSAELVS